MTSSKMKKAFATPGTAFVGRRCTYFWDYMGEGMVHPENGPFFLNVFFPKQNTSSCFFPIVSPFFLHWLPCLKEKLETAIVIGTRFFLTLSKLTEFGLGKNMLPRLNRRDALHGWEFDV